jgi:hypothetical protein
MSAAKKDLDAPSAAVLEQVVLNGDLAALKPMERVLYYRRVCESLNLNPLTQPFSYLRLQNRLTLYANSDCADQLRALHGISVRVASAAVEGDLYVVRVEAQDKAGRTDSDLGAVAINQQAGEHKANLMMKCLTKAKRRVTLSICGLGWADMIEMETVPGTQPVKVDPTTGEILEEPKAQPEAKGTRTQKIAEELAERVSQANTFTVTPSPVPVVTTAVSAPPAEKPAPAPEPTPPAPVEAQAAAEEPDDLFGEATEQEAQALFQRAALAKDIRATRKGFKTVPSDAQWRQLLTAYFERDMKDEDLEQMDVVPLQEFREFLIELRKRAPAAVARYQAFKNRG